MDFKPVDLGTHGDCSYAMWICFYNIDHQVVRGLLGPKGAEFRIWILSLWCGWCYKYRSFGTHRSRNIGFVLCIGVLSLWRQLYVHTWLDIALLYVWRLIYTNMTKIWIQVRWQILSTHVMHGLWTCSSKT